ncbi:hypothetical protein LCL98_07955 [Rossellomorea aquimaris]|nr:hypothetical protein [Rossellomorea aquimaris]
MLISLLGLSARDLFITKYQYLTNMKSMYEKNVSVSHAILLEMESGEVASRQLRGDYGEIGIQSEIMNPEEIKLEVTFKRNGKVFLPTTVVYNKGTKHIIRWE